MAEQVIVHSGASSSPSHGRRASRNNPSPLAYASTHSLHCQTISHNWFLHLHTKAASFLFLVYNNSDAQAVCCVLLGKCPMLIALLAQSIILM